MKQIWLTKLNSADTLVALKLADHARDDGTSIYPSIAAIVKRTRLSERTVQRSLRSLEKIGLLEIVRSARHRSTREYRIALPALARMVEEGRETQGDDSPTDGNLGGSQCPPSQVQGRHGDTPRGDMVAGQGCHGDTQTIIEPSYEPKEKHAPDCFAIDPKGSIAEPGDCGSHVSALIAEGRAEHDRIRRGKWRDRFEDRKEILRYERQDEAEALAEAEAWRNAVEAASVHPEPVTVEAVAQHISDHDADGDDIKAGAIAVQVTAAADGIMTPIDIEPASADSAKAVIVSSSVAETAAPIVAGPVPALPAVVRPRPMMSPVRKLAATQEAAAATIANLSGPDSSDEDRKWGELLGRLGERIYNASSLPIPDRAARPKPSTIAGAPGSLGAILDRILT